MTHSPRGVCLMCGQPGTIGLCSACDVLRDLDGMALHAMWDALPRHRAEHRRVFLAPKIEEAELNGRHHIVLPLERARVLRDAWAAVEFEAWPARACRISAPMLPVGEHLRPHPRRNLLANVPPELRAKLPPAFADALERVPVNEQVDRTQHPLGWGYDLVRFVPLELAEALPWEGQA